MYTRFHRYTLKFLEQYFLYAATNLRGVFLSRDIDDAGKEATECISAQEELNACAILQIQDADGRADQVMDGALKQLIPRVGVENM